MIASVYLEKVLVLLQVSKTGDIGTAWSLQLSFPVLRAPNEDAYAFLLLSGARPAALDLLGNTRAGVGVCSVVVVVGVAFL